MTITILRIILRMMTIRSPITFETRSTTIIQEISIVQLPTSIISPAQRRFQ